MFSKRAQNMEWNELEFEPNDMLDLMFHSDVCAKCCLLEIYIAKYVIKSPTFLFIDVF